MSLPVSIGDIVTLVQISKSIYDKVKGQQEKIDKAAKKVLNMESYLHNLGELLTRNEGIGYNSLAGAQRASMRDMLKEINADVVQANQLLRDYRDRRGPLNTTFNFDTGFKLYFASDGAKKLDAISDDLDKKMVAIDQWTTQLTTTIAFQILANTQKQRPKSPLPPPKTGLKVLFVDKDNDGRSKIAEAYAKLVNQWTSVSRDMWPMAVVHSVGLRVKRRNECVAQLDKINVGCPHEGNKPPDDLAVRALFDNKLFAYPCKPKIRAAIESSRSRGPTSSLFVDYDYVVTFTKGLEMSLVRLRQELAVMGGRSAASKGKGKIILLGDYGTGGQGSIWSPGGDGSEEERLEKWKKTVALIKVSYKEFLRKELGWVQPGRMRVV